MIKAVLCALLLVSMPVQAQLKAAPSTVQLLMPCLTTAVTRIWVDEEIFWDAKVTGNMVLEPCEMLQLNVKWYESIVVEYLVMAPQGVRAFRFRLFPDGRFVPEHKVPTSKRLDV